MHPHARPHRLSRPRVPTLHRLILFRHLPSPNPSPTSFSLPSPITRTVRSPENPLPCHSYSCHSHRPRPQPSVSRQHHFHLQFSTCRLLQFPSFSTCQLRISRFHVRHLHWTTRLRLQTLLCALPSSAIMSPCLSKIKVNSHLIEEQESFQKIDQYANAKIPTTLVTTATTFFLPSLKLPTFSTAVTTIPTATAATTSSYMTMAIRMTSATTTARTTESATR